MTTKWSDPAVCFNGKRPAEIPQGAVVIRWLDNEWKYGGRWDWRDATAERPVIYRYEHPPVETEPFAVVFDKDNDLSFTVRRSADGERWLDSASAFAQGQRTVRFYDKHGNQVEAEALEEAGG